MDRIALSASDRSVLGKKVKKLRQEGLTPAHVFGNQVETEHVTVSTVDFQKAYDSAGETGLIDLKIGEDKIRPVLIRDVQYDPIKDQVLHIDFYQVNLKEKVQVPVPLVLVGEEPEKVHSGDAVVLQTLSEVQVEALPTDLVESIEVNQNSLKEIDDSITVADLSYDRSKLTILSDGEEVVVKLAPAVTEEMKALMEEQAAEQAAAAEAAGEGEEATEGEAVEGEEASEGEESTEAKAENPPTGGPEEAKE